MMTFLLSTRKLLVVQVYKQVLLTICDTDTALSTLSTLMVKYQCMATAVALELLLDTSFCSL